jgi:hypothetical protein
LHSGIRYRLLQVYRVKELAADSNYYACDSDVNAKVVAIMGTKDRKRSSRIQDLNCPTAHDSEQLGSLFRGHPGCYDCRCLFVNSTWVQKGSISPDTRVYPTSNLKCPIVHLILFFVMWTSTTTSTPSTVGVCNHSNLTSQPAKSLVKAQSH